MFSHREEHVPTMVPPVEVDVAIRTLEALADASSRGLEMDARENRLYEVALDILTKWLTEWNTPWEREDEEPDAEVHD